MDLIAISKRVATRCGKLSFAPPVTHIYNPLVYAREAHLQYLERFGAGKREVILLGMNPGPWGMAQTGVPFGDVTMVRDWMGIEAPVDKPPKEHPKRPVLGFECTRGEVSGTRLWGWAKERFGTPEKFFKRFFVWNYCPLSFMEESGRNFTPDKLPPRERAPLFKACDAALLQLVDAMAPEHVIGIGKFAEKRAQAALADSELRVGGMLHPSPASPAANKGWAKAADSALARYRISIP